MKIKKVCTICKIEKELNSSSWYANSECSACRARARYSKSNRNDYKNNWRKENKEHHLEYMRKYKAEKLLEDDNYKLKNALRKRISEAIKNNRKASSAISELSCSIEEARLHLESQFIENMSWDNYGEWHIDHIEPLVNFDLTDEEQFKKACHYTNLQPLWAKDNLSKGNLSKGSNSE